MVKQLQVTLPFFLHPKHTRRNTGHPPVMNGALMVYMMPRIAGVARQFHFTSTGHEGFLPLPILYCKLHLWLFLHNKVVAEDLEDLARARAPAVGATVP